MIETRLINNIADARSLFPGTEQKVYMDVAGRGILSRPVRAAIDAFLDAAFIGGDKPAMFSAVEGARSGFARLINCHPDEVAITKNISEGLNIVATGITWERGDNVVLCEELEHANNVYVWRNLQQRCGIEIRNIRMRDGMYPIEQMIAAIDDRTRILTVSTNTFTPGFRTDLDTLSAACKKMDVILLLDGAQSIGISAMDVGQLPVDAIATSTQKGLLGLYGMGFLYVRRALAEQMSPLYLARFGVDLRDMGEAALGGHDYDLMPGARRFDLGNYNYVAAVAVEESQQLLNHLGVAAIESHTTMLGNSLASGLAELGLPVYGEPVDKHRRHIVSVGRIGAGHDATSDPKMQSLYDTLLEQGVKLSIRKNMLRFSLHLYNNTDDVARVIEIAKAWRRHST